MGATKSRLWNEIQSAVIGKPVIVPVERDASAIGVSICAAVGSELYDNIKNAVKEMVHMEQPFRSEVKFVEYYDKLYHRWIETRQRLSGIL